MGKNLDNFYLKSKNLVKLAFNDFSESIKLWRYWITKSLIETRLIYKNARLGTLWIILSFLFQVLVLATVWSIVLGRKDPMIFFSYLASGLLVWQFISSSITASTKLLSRTSNTNDHLLFLSLFSMLSKNGIKFVINFIPVTLIALLFGTTDLLSIISNAPIAIVMLIIWVLGASMLISSFCMIFSEFSQIIQSIMKISFLVTPILWDTSRVGEHTWILWLNPFFPILDFVRYSLSGLLSLTSVPIIAAFQTIIIFFIGFFSIARYHRKIRLNRS